MGKLEQLSIGAVDKKRDFFENRVFHRRNFLELLLENSGKYTDEMVQFLLMFFTQNPLPSQQTEVLLRQRL